MFDEPILAKATVQVTVVMMAVVVLGFIAVGIMLKVNGYPHGELADFVRWNPLAVFLRKDGMYLLWVPVVWTFVAVVAQRRDRGRLYAGTFWVGVALTVSMLAMFITAIAKPYTIPFMIIKAKESAKAAKAEER